VELVEPGWNSTKRVATNVMALFSLDWQEILTLDSIFRILSDFEQGMGGGLKSREERDSTYFRARFTI